MNKIGFLIFFGIFISINLYIFFRGRQALPDSFVLQTIYTIVFVFLAFSFLIAVFFEKNLPSAIIAICENVGGFWLVTFLYFLLAILIGDIVRISDHFLGFLPERTSIGYQQIKLIYFATVLLILGVFSSIGYYRFSHPATVSLNLDVAKKSNGKTSLSIAAVSDVHLGNMIRKNRLSQYVQKINSQNADIILIAGDLFDRNLHTVEQQNMESELRKLKAKYGVYAILGNHEYFGNVNKAMEIINRSNIKLLKDSAITIDNSFVLIGRDDYTNRRRRPLKNIVETINSSLPVILLDHQPVHLNEAVENKIDLQISGHTHNGQIYPINKIVARMYEVGYGYKKNGNTHFYVSSGLGLWGAPIRLGTQSEFMKIRLNFLSAAK